jgi:hypothetical protein
MAVPAGIYSGRAEVVPHEDGFALALWGARNVTNGRAIRDGARYKPRELERWIADKQLVEGDIVNVTFARVSPHISMVLRMSRPRSASRLKGRQVALRST